MEKKAALQFLKYKLKNTTQQNRSHYHTQSYIKKKLCYHCFFIELNCGWWEVQVIQVKEQLTHGR